MSIIIGGNCPTGNFQSSISFYISYSFRPSTSNESSDEESESSYSDVPRKARKTTKSKSKVETRKRNRAVNYVVPNSDSDSDLDEFMDYEEEETQQSVVVETGNTDTIEKVLKNRNGAPGATGSQTTWYNIQNQGDPNEKISGEWALFF